MVCSTTESYNGRAKCQGGDFLLHIHLFNKHLLGISYQEHIKMLVILRKIKYVLRSELGGGSRNELRRAEHNLLIQYGKYNEKNND